MCSVADYYTPKRATYSSVRTTDPSADNRTRRKGIVLKSFVVIRGATTTLQGYELKFLKKLNISGPIV